MPRLKIKLSSRGLLENAPETVWSENFSYNASSRSSHNKLETKMIKANRVSWYVWQITNSTSYGHGKEKEYSLWTLIKRYRTFIKRHPRNKVFIKHVRQGIQTDIYRKHLVAVASKKIEVELLLWKKQALNNGLLKRRKKKKLSLMIFIEYTIKL